MRTLTRRGFIMAAASAPFAPGEMAEAHGTKDFGENPTFTIRVPTAGTREVTFYKGRSVGPTTGVLENAIGYFLYSVSDGTTVEFKPRAPTVAENAHADQPSDHRAFDGMNYDGPHQWATSDSNPIDDIKAFFAEYDSPEARAARRREYEYDLARFGRLLTLAGYGHLVPPPYRSAR